MTDRLPYPPPFQDIRTLSAHICASEGTIENWVRLGFLPAPRLIRGKRLWRWSDVERKLAGDGVAVAPCIDEEAERVRNATRKALAPQAGKDH